MSRLLTTLLIFAFWVSNLTGQTWKQYHIPTNTTTLLNYTITSTVSSNNTNSNTGILQSNLSADTLRNFDNIDLVNDPNAFPWRMTVKFGGVTGVLIDPYHVLTAGHTVALNQSFGTTKFYPAYGLADSPYGFAYPEYVYLPNNYAVSSATDYAIIKLDRPLGSLTGWVGYGYNNDNNYYLNNKTFFNPSYPSAGNFNGELLYNWKGKMEYVTGEYVYSFRTGIAGMSGSPLYTSVNNNLVTYGVLTSTGIKFNKININKFDAITYALNKDIPASFDIVPLTVSAYPKTLKAGNNLDSISFYLTNYSSVNYTNQQVNAAIYLSQDSIITDSDVLLQTYNVTSSINSLSAQKVLLSNVAVSGLSSGNYWIGLKLTGDNNLTNNVTGYRDAYKITVVNTDYVKISGRVTSSQSNSGISGVTLQGLTNTYTDFNGNYTAYVPSGFSGNIIPVKEGYDFTPASFSVNSIVSPLQQNITTAKKTYTLTISVKSPVQQSGVAGVQATELLSEPYSNNSGMITATVFHGWSGSSYMSKDGWMIEPYSLSYNKITSNTSSSVTAGFRLSGYVYDDNGAAIQGAQMQGISGNVISNASGYYSAFLDSGWTGTVVPVKNNIVFSPLNRVYTDLNYTVDYQDFQQLSPVYANIKIFLSGPYSTGSDTMSCALKQRNYFPATPPETFSSNVNPFILEDYRSYTYTGTEQRIVDWVVIEILNSKDYTPVDTVAAVVRYDGKLLSTTGETMIPLKFGLEPGYYYYVIRHRNHIAVMSNYETYIYKYSDVYDFTTSTDMYWGNEARLLKAGLYGMYTGDADYDGHVDIDDYNIYNNSTIIAEHGYKISDFNLDGYVTSYDFVLLAPNKKLNITTYIQSFGKKKTRK
ncbi:MAG: trypsin-like serine protease [Ignavibacteria bacterium]